LSVVDSVLVVAKAPMRSRVALNSVTSFVSSLCAALLVIALLVHNAFAQEKPRLKDFGSSLKKDSKKKQAESRTNGTYGDNADDVIRVRTDLVVSDVMVVNDRGNAILGLDRGDFVISEDGHPQEIGSFALGDAPAIPRSIVLIMDYSSSQLPYIKTSIDAAKTLVDKLGPRDRMALVTDDVKLLVDFTADKALLKGTLESLKNRALSHKFGLSLQYKALMATLRELFTAEDLRPIIILQTDGDQLDFLRGFSYKDVETTVEKSRVTIYTIIPSSLIGIGEKERIRRVAEVHELINNYTGRYTASIETLRTLVKRTLIEHISIAKLARLSGGWPDSLDQPEQADEVYGRIFTDINSRYVIGYYPSNKEHDGKRRNVKIEVRGHPEYVVWGRKTYFAPAQ
jgi:VWFA-related protein